MKITMYSKTGCPYCQKSKEFFKENKIEFEEILLEKFDERQKLYDKFGLDDNKRTVPQILIDGIRIGGYTELMASDILDVHNSGKFDEDF